MNESKALRSLSNSTFEGNSVVAVRTKKKKSEKILKKWSQKVISESAKDKGR